MRDEDQFEDYWTKKREAERTELPSVWTYRYWLTILPLAVVGALALAWKTHQWPFN